MLQVDLVHSLRVIRARCEISLSCRESETLVISFVGNLDIYRYSLTVSRMKKFSNIQVG
jgi:hypothetical protein